MLNEFTISIYILKIKGTYSNSIQQKQNKQTNKKQEKIDPPEINPKTRMREQVLYFRGTKHPYRSEEGKEMGRQPIMDGFSTELYLWASGA